MSNRINITIRPIVPEDARRIAVLHISGIGTGFISSLGVDFVTSLYKGIAESKLAFGFVAQGDKEILGFVAFSTNLTSLYKSVVLKKGLRFAFLLAGKMLSLQRIKKAFETLFYPKRVKRMDVPDAELLSTVVTEEEQGKGLATKLVERGLEECTKRRIDKVKVLVGADNELAKKLYLKCGFEFVGQMDNHGVISNVYVAETRID